MKDLYRQNRVGRKNKIKPNDCPSLNNQWNALKSFSGSIMPNVYRQETLLHALIGCMLTLLFCHTGKFLMKIIMHQRAVKMRLNTMILWRNFHLITQRWQRYWQNNLVHIDFNSGIQASICYTTVLMWLWLAHALTLGISHVKSPFVQLLQFKMKFWSKLSI